MAVRAGKEETQISASTRRALSFPEKTKTGARRFLFAAKNRINRMKEGLSREVLDRA
jgi:hypothetical protein